MQNFEKLFENLTKQYDHSVVFNDFLAFSVDQFRIDMQPKHFHHDTYNKEDYKIFFALFEELINHTNVVLQDTDNEWYDMLGHFYVDIIQSKWKAGTRGQFFTPVSVVEALAELTVDNGQEDGKVYRVLDSACGSCRTLLAYHVRRPFDICVGQDLDRTSCLMSVLNFVLHGVKGLILNMNSLSGEFYGAWKVNEYVDLGLPMTVEFMTSMEHLGFVGEEFDGVSVEVPQAVFKEDRLVEVKETKQTTLI